MEYPQNRYIALLASAIRSASLNDQDRSNEQQRGVVLTIDMTAVPGVDTVTFTIEGKDPLSGKYYTILASTALVATGTVILKVYPGLVAAANAAVNDVLPRAWRLKIVHSAGTNFTYSVSAQLIL